MFYLDKKTTIISTKKEIVDLTKHKVDEDYAAFTKMDLHYKMPLSHGKMIVDCGLDLDGFHGETTINNISVEFARIETEDEILNFSKRYGLLGLGNATKFMHFLDDNRDIHYYIDAFSYDGSTAEPIKLWYWHIKHVKKILQLARALSKIQRGLNTEIEENLLYISDPPFPKMESPRPDLHYQYVYWYDHIYTNVSLFRTDYSFRKVAMNVLINSITSMLRGAINLGVAGFVENKSSKYGFKIIEERSTSYLLAAIYYDLWQMIAKDEPIKTCNYIKCGNPFRAVGRKKYCCDSCRVLDFNYQKKRKGENNG